MRFHYHCKSAVRGILNPYSWRNEHSDGTASYPNEHGDGKFIA